MKYGKCTNKDTLKVRRKCGTATVKVRLNSTELVRLHKVCFNRTLNNVWKLFFDAYCMYLITRAKWNKDKIVKITISNFF